MSTKRTLYLIEGLPGTGKSTISNWLHEKIGSKCILEDDLYYPNDLCNVAGIPLDVYKNICFEFPMISNFIELRGMNTRGMNTQGMYQYINIEAVRNSYPNQHALLSLLEKWDIGDEFNPHMSLSHYIPCSLELFSNRLTQLEQKYDSLIFDSVWLQNPINELLSRNADTETIIKYCSSFADLLKNFSLTCIYLKRDSAEETIKFACHAKGEGWTSRVTELFTKTPYGITHSLVGSIGLIQYFSERAKIEDEILSRRIINCFQYTVDENNWDKVKASIWADIINN